MRCRMLQYCADENASLRSDLWQTRDASVKPIVPAVQHPVILIPFSFQEWWSELIRIGSPVRWKVGGCSSIP